MLANRKLFCSCFSIIYRREAGFKLVSSIRAALVKGRSNGDPVYAAADDVAGELKERIAQMCTAQNQSSVGTGISPARVKRGELIFEVLIYQMIKTCC